MQNASEAGPCIPGYRIVSTLGAGGMASVYLAVQESLDREVALKVMTPALAADREFALRFLKEGRITARLNHPNLLTVFDIGQQGPIYYLAAEYLPGGTLSDRIKRGISVAESLAVVCDIARGLHLAHDAGFVHRDVKPGNVMFRASGVAVLADFGIAKSIAGATAVTSAGSWVGTPRYMSPEQINAAAVDGRSDLYSLGVVLFEMLTGKPPYEASEPITVALMHLSHPLPQLPEALAWLQPLIDGLMAKDVAARFATGEAIVAAVERLLIQTPEGIALRTAASASAPAPYRLSPADPAAAIQRPHTASHALPVPTHVSNEPLTSRAHVFPWRIVAIGVVAMVALLGSVKMWNVVSARSGIEAAETGLACESAATRVTLAIDQADLGLASSTFAAMPRLCSTDREVSEAGDALKAALDRAATARRTLLTALDQGDIAAARTALGALERVDRSASDLPDWHRRLEQARNRRADSANTTPERAPEATPHAAPQNTSPRAAIPAEHAESAPPQRQHPSAATAVRRPDTHPAKQQSDNCRDISLRAGLGEETAEERLYLRENCR